MKITIEYEYDDKFVNPFVAKTKMYGIIYCGLSDLSYEQAEQNLIDKLEDKNLRNKVPFPKEIEIGENMFYSNCCTYPLRIYQEICPKCLRKCGVDIVCKECKGDGQIEQYLYTRRGIKGAEIKVNEVINCNRCDGFGFIGYDKEEL